MADKKNKCITHNISTTAILKVVAVIFVIWFLYLIKHVVGILFVALILASAVDPVVDWFERQRIPRFLSILFIYLTLIIVFSSVIILLIPAIGGQIKQLSETFPIYWEKIMSGFSHLKNYSSQYGLGGDISESLKRLTASVTSVDGGIFSFVGDVFGGIVSVFVVLVITFYMVVQENTIKRTLRFVAPTKYVPYLTQLFNRIQRKIGLWLRGQLILCLIVGVLAYIGLLVLGVKYALLLGLIAGICEIVPYLGPIMGAVPAVFLAFTQDPILGLAVIILYIVIQLVENNILVPKVMQKTIGLNPILSITALLIGARIGGVTGALLAIPVATALSVVVEDFFEEKDRLSCEKKD